jgi:phosphate uptake regulator
MLIIMTEQDAKLSTAERKKLKGSTFCGPNRSFPVPDCAHVTAARRLIGRAKVGAATKKKILSCVSSKASKLGCGGKDTLSDEAVEELIASESFASTRELVAFLEDVSDAVGDELKVNLAVTLDNVRSIKKEVEPSQDRVDKYAQRSIESLVDAVNDELTSAIRSRVSEES